MKPVSTFLLSLVLLALPGFLARAEEPAPAASESPSYEAVTQERAAKIVATLGLSDANRANRVRDIIARQYQDLSRIHDARDARIEAAKKLNEGGKAAVDAAVESIRAESTAALNRLHAAYLARLGAELSPAEVEKVKDGMTYGVAPLTYGVYLRMYPALTKDQKQQVLDWLHEARESAMDAGSSKEKHAVFGKYKGRINNYLVKQGYDLKEGEANLKRPAQPATDSEKN